MGPDVRAIVSRRIREVRTAKGLTQEFVSAHAGLTRANYSRLENGLAVVKVTTLYRIAQALGVRLADLLEGLD
jgi:transcriptional regulator with XRE-family HTH domain